MALERIIKSRVPLARLLTTFATQVTLRCAKGTHLSDIKLAHYRIHMHNPTKIIDNYVGRL